MKEPMRGWIHTETYLIGLIRRYLVGRHGTLYSIHSNSSQVDKKGRKVKLTSIVSLGLTVAFSTFIVAFTVAFLLIVGWTKNL